MQSLIAIIIIGLIGGFAIGLQNPLASLLSQRLGMLESVFIVHIGGVIAVALPLFIMRGGNLHAWPGVPWYALGAGGLGLVIISAISYTIPRLGVATTIMLIVVGQLLIGTLLDHFGLLGTMVRPFDFSKLLGIVVLLLGVWLMLR